MFKKLLIANRGEIACRILRTASRLGLRTVAVYSDADAHARHVRLADEAVRLGPAQASESYLNIEALLAAARATGADAVHPGYGFLSENPRFAQACLQAKLVWIGPTPEAISALGSKSAAKRIAEAAGVPTVPGYAGDDQSDDQLLNAARRTGFPVMLKAVAGGGGKGMRVVRTDREWPDSLAAARREARAAFGSDAMMVEKYLQRPRHVEVQVFGDTYGQVVHLFERDCSIQRRHQKVIEESPAPRLAQSTRHSLGAAAVTIASAVGYLGAGTVEFILDESGAFYFLEMNTRLQVEHPVTEMITDLDLVEWQLRVAAGERLPRGQEDIGQRGHAIEARLYAEDPTHGFLPSAGTLELFRLPAEGPHVRVETGVESGDNVSVHYDPLLAKLVVWGADRAAAVRQLVQALAQVRVVGPVTNRDFLAAIASHPRFLAAETDTSFLDQHRAALLPASGTPSDATVALAGLYLLLDRKRSLPPNPVDPHSPWRNPDSWRLNHDSSELLRLAADNRELAVRVTHGREVVFELPSGAMPVSGEFDETGDLLANLDGRRITATVVRRGDELFVTTAQGSQRFTVIDPHAQAEESETVSGRVEAPMPGKVIGLPVRSGEAVVRGAVLFVMEAMKMEHTAYAPCDGVVKAIHCRVGDTVLEGAQVLEFVPAGAETGEP